jgi:hypothetical protein
MSWKLNNNPVTEELIETHSYNCNNKYISKLRFTDYCWFSLAIREIRPLDFVPKVGQNI